MGPASEGVDGQWALFGVVFVAQVGHLRILFGPQPAQKPEDKWVEDMSDTLAKEDGFPVALVHHPPKF